MVKPSDPKLDRLMSYWYYEVINTSHVRLSPKSKNSREQVKMFQEKFENTTLNREGLILVFDFLTTFAEKADTFVVFVAHAFLILPRLLKSRTEKKR